MSLGFREERRRRRRRTYVSLAKWAAALLLVLAAGFYAYGLGSRLAQQRVTELEGRITTLTETVAMLEQQAVDRERAAAEERREAENWRARYEREVPEGAVKTILDLARKRLEEGVEADRLAFVIGAVGNNRRCDPEPVTKRFLVRTAHSRGNDRGVTFAEGSITVAAEGAFARDSAGNPETWFDPAEEITVRITHVNGEAREMSGKLPVAATMVVAGSEHRFTFSASSRGLVQVVSIRCDFP